MWEADKKETALQDVLDQDPLSTKISQLFAHENKRTK